MNSKTIFRRTLPLIIALALIIIVTVLFTVFSKDKKIPQISNANGTFLKVDDITVNNDEVYKDVKFSYGIGTLVDLLDIKLLSTTKNADGVDYYSAVTQEEIDDRIEETIFPSGRSGDDEADEKTIKTWERTQFVSYGLKDEDDYNRTYRLTIAKEKYTKDQLAKDEDLIDDDDISTYYDENYEKAYWVVLVKYNTSKEATDALNQLGIKAEKVETDGKTADKWVWAETSTPLTLEEIKQAHIDLYNNAYAYKAPGYPNASNPELNKILGSNQYTVKDGVITFNTTLSDEEDSPSNWFYYKASDLSALSSSLTTEISGMDSFTTEDATLERTYIRNPLSAGSYYYFALKITYELPEDLFDEDGEVVNQELYDEIYAKVLEEKVTSSTILEKMNELRSQDGNLIIYDATLEAKYISSYDSKHKETKKESSNIVLEILGTDIKITADDLFEELKELYGAKTAYSLYFREMVLHSEYNDIYDVDTEKVLNKKKWEEIKEEVDSIKSTFASGQWVDPSYGWNNFLRDYYNLNSETELKIDLVYSRALEEYQETLYETTEEVYENIYVPKMQEIYDEYFSSTGIHLLIYKEDEDGNTVSPLEEGKWTAYEKSLAEELYDLILDDISKLRPSKIETYLETTLVEAYENAPRFLADTIQDVDYQPVYSEEKDWLDLDADSYKYSKYKSAGLLIKYQDLSTITAGQMVEPFENAVKTIWKEAEAKNIFNDDIVIYGKNYEDYLVTEFGYHVYINTSTNQRPSVTVSSESKVAAIPSYKDIMVYEGTPVEGEEDRELTTLETKGITTFYSPIRSEMSGTYYIQIKMSEELLELVDEDKVEFTDEGLLELYKRSLNYNVELAYESLTYFEADK